MNIFSVFFCNSLLQRDRKRQINTTDKLNTNIRHISFQANLWRSHRFRKILLQNLSKSFNYESGKSKRKDFKFTLYSEVSLDLEDLRIEARRNNSVKFEDSRQRNPFKLERTFYF